MANDHPLFDDEDVFFGDVDAPLPDWRNGETQEDNDSDDDEPLPKTPEDVVASLGFDPLDDE